jgi:hypothetical protein
VQIESTVKLSGIIATHVAMGRRPNTRDDLGLDPAGVINCGPMSSTFGQWAIATHAAASLTLQGGYDDGARKFRGSASAM